MEDSWRDLSRWCTYSISSTQLCHMAKKYFSHSSLVIYFLFQPHSWNWGLQRRCWNTNTKPRGINRYDGPTRNTEHQSDHIYYTLFCVCTNNVAVPSTSHSKQTSTSHSKQTVELCWAITIFLSQTVMFWLFFIQFFGAWSYTQHNWRCSWLFSDWRMQIENPSDVGRPFVFPPMKAGKH
jgi:hypothetical protein